MLGRTANDLYWMARYVERAENMGRLLEVGQRLSLLTHESGDNEWRSMLRSAGCEQGYLNKHAVYESDKLIEFLLLDRDNPSSVCSCFDAARRNARAQRTAITREMWESLNSGGIELAERARPGMKANDLPPLFDWVRNRSALFRGAMLNTILRNDTYFFTQLGTFVERADNTARILDVKYYVLLPQNELVGGGVDSAQWAAILRSVSAHRSFRWVYRDAFKPWHIAEFLMLSPEMPRSLRSCYVEITSALAGLAEHYRQRQPCLDLAQRTLKTLEDSDMSSIFQSGLHEFVSDFIRSNTRLANEVAATYYFNN